MINTTIRYIVYNHGGTGVRHHHFSAQNNIINEADGMASPGDTITALGIPSLIFNGATVPFAFMSVHGAADGNHLFTTAGNQAIPVGSSNIDILVVYAPAGGIGSGGGPGVWVDAFNVDTGNFSDSDFLQVLTPPTPPDTVDVTKSTHANAEGDISTITAENVRAFASVDGAPFLEWKRILPPESIVGSRDVSLAQNQTNEIWLAFYQTPQGGTPIRIKQVLEEALGQWVDDDYCGTPVPHHIGPGGPIFRLSINEKVLNSTQREELQTYVREYPAAAKAAYSEMTKVTTILQGVQRVISETKSSIGQG